MILFDSVKTYVEQVGRRRTINHWNVLDSLEVIFNGPTANVESWIPKIGEAFRPDYPTMTADSIEVLNEAAGVTELRVTYVGKFYDMGPVAVGSSSHWGESSWTTGSQMTTPFHTFRYDYTGGQTQSIPITTFITSYVSYSWVCRYQIETVTYKALRKDPVPLIGKDGGKILSQSRWMSGASFLDSSVGLVHAQLSFAGGMIDRQVSPLNNGWYEISESWGPQPIVVSGVSSFAPTVTVSTTMPAFAGQP